MLRDMRLPVTEINVDPLSQYPRKSVRDNIKKAQQDLLSVVRSGRSFFARPTGIMMM